LEESLGEGALDIFHQKAKENMRDMNNLATLLHKNFSELL